ncbi:MAG: NUDIX hydrolase [Candidatus Micrarchaeia archaeon]
MGKRRPFLVVDAIIVDGERVVLVRRKNPPFAGKWALPGGFVEYGETCEKACIREVKEETGLDVEILDLVGVFSDPARDPRGHTVSVAYQCRKSGGRLKGSDDATEARWFDIKDLPELAFDHELIMRGFLEKARNQALQ